jgi:hypothetical protein
MTATTFVAGGHVFQVLVDFTFAPKSMAVTIRADGEREWTFEEPGWRPLGYGLGDHGFYLWSARRLISFGDAGLREPELIALDEDIIAVFHLGRTWLAVCETSVRLLGHAGELSRVELHEVATQVRLDGRVLVLDGPSGVQIKLDVGAKQLSMVD